MIQFTCTCGQALSAEDRDAGKMTACPKCGAHLPIPSASAIQAAQPAPRRESEIASGPPSYRAERDDADYDRPRRPEAGGTSGKAVTSMILGLLSFCIPLILSIPAIILGFVGLADTKKGKSGAGFAIAGIVTGFMSIFLMLPVMLIALLLPAVAKVREAAARLESANNMKMILIGFHSYHDANGKIPNHAIYGPDGQPLLSWRVAILPFVEEGLLYNQFKLDEPWDSPNNIQLAARMPKIYAHPVEPEAAANGMTFYQVFVGEPNEQPRPIFVKKSLADMTLMKVTDGTSNTILLTEASNPVIWTKPEDIPYSMNQRIPKLGVMHNIIQVGMADGSVRPLSPNVQEATLRAAITANGGEVLMLD